MNIALFTDCYFPTKNGVVTVVHQLRESLEQLGHHVVIVTTKPNGNYEEDPNIYRASNSMPFTLGGAKDQYLAFIWWPKLKLFLQQHRVEIIHCHTEFSVGIMGYRAARKLNIPCVMTTHTMWEDYIQNYLHVFENFLPVQMSHPYLHYIYKHFPCMIGVSGKVRDYNKRDYVAPQVPCVVIHNSLNPDKFMTDGTEDEKILKAKEIRDSLGIADDETMLLYVGRIALEKRSFDLFNSIIPVLEEDPKAKMVFVGDGPIYKQLVKSAQHTSVKDRIIFTGFVEWQNVGAYYKASDFFVTSSVTECCPMTIIEAFIGETPVVCPKDGAYSFSVINGETGYQTESDDDFTDKVLKLCHDSDLRKEMGLKAKAKSAEFMPDVFVKRHLHLYETLIENHGKSQIDEEKLQIELDAIK